MKSNVLITSIILASVLAIIGASIVNAEGYASWSAIKETGYAVTSNWHGIDVPVGQSVVVTAGTTDLTITNIVFRWHNPSDNVMFEENVPVSANTTPNVPPNVPQEVTDWANSNTGVQYLYAQSTYTPLAIGDWGVQAFFIGPNGKQKAGLENVVKVRATSFNVVPEVPIIGTAGAAVAMLLGFGLYFKKKK